MVPYIPIWLQYQISQSASGALIVAYIMVPYIPIWRDYQISQTYLKIQLVIILAKKMGAVLELWGLFCAQAGYGAVTYNNMMGGLVLTTLRLKIAPKPYVLWFLGTKHHKI